MEARQKVQPISFAKLKEWRDEDDSNELEETFREIIVIDDDDDESDTSDGTLSDGERRDRSLEIVSSRATARELQPDYHAGVSRGDAHGWRLIPQTRNVPRTMDRPQRIVANSNLHSGSVYRADARLPLPSAPIRSPHKPYLHEPYLPPYEPVAP